MKIKYFLISLMFAYPCLAQEPLSFMKADLADEIKINKDVWRDEISKLQNKKTNFYYDKVDLTGLGSDDLISFIESDETCGMRSCPMKIVSNGKVIFQSYVPMERGAIDFFKIGRGFYPDILINGIKYSFFYDENRYKLINDIKNTFPLKGEACEVCFKQIPSNPLKSSSYKSFAEELEYEAISFGSDKGVGKYKFSPMALMRIGLITNDNLFDLNETKWSKKAKKMGILSIQDFLESEIAQEKALQMYVSYIHNLAKDYGIEAKICQPLTDIYNRKGLSDYWGVLKGVYTFGLSTISMNTKDYDGTDVNKQILDGSAINNLCIKKIITGSQIDKNMLLYPESKNYKPRGKIE